MNGFNWNNIISYNDSQNNAFEELVCQLAREEETPNKVSFTRVGNPDGGVEAYCVLENGAEYGWQAKFFDSVGQVQWRQLDESVKTALEKHPNLTKYYICLPVDRADPRIPKQRWFMNAWDDKVLQWRRSADTQGRSVEFEYWGSSELLARLSQERHAGRMKFWFNQIDLSAQWFSDQVGGSISDLGARYTPKLNFRLPIAKIFDFVGRDEHFREHVDSAYDDVLKKISKGIASIHDQELSDYKKMLGQQLSQIRNTYENISFETLGQIDIDAISSVCEATSACLSSLQERIRELQTSEKAPTEGRRADRFNYVQHNLHELRGSLCDFRDFVGSPELRLANVPVLVLDGSGGVGKSHLIADISKKRLQEGKLSVLLLGQHFVSSDNPWTQILRNILRLDCNEKEFLGALEAKAQSIGSRIIVFIDALNEGHGPSFWHDHIKSFIELFQTYKWLGLVLSIRSSYVRKTVPESLVSSDLAVRIPHTGFRNLEYEASKHFFRYYEIQQPSIPLLHPDFQNALYLKLFCEGLHKRDLTTIPDGYEGITAVIDFYLETLNKHLSHANRYDYSDSLELVQRAVTLIAQKRVERDLDYIPYSDANETIEEEIGSLVNRAGFLDALVSEGVVSKNLYWDNSGNDIEAVFLTYQRFEDHIVASYLISKNVDPASPETAFSEGQVLHELTKNLEECYYNSRIIEALSVQLPEKTGKDLYELAPYCKEFDPVKEAFLESLIWRRKDTIGQKHISYINQYIIDYAGDRFFDTLLSVTSIPDHFLNAEFLHRNLMRLSLPDRDAWWTIYLNRQIYEPTPTKRLIDWAWSDEDKGHISDESILLSAKALSWFLTSCNRVLRDSATKALIAMLENRMKVLTDLLRDFESVNDPYVYERLFAVAYGCALRTKDVKCLNELSQYIYQTIFDEEFVYPHVLLRDYAREVIEYSLYLKLDLDLDVDKVRPPYKSNWYDSIPTTEEIKEYELDYKDPGFKDYHWSQHAIVSSMQPEYSDIGMYGDFGRYVFQSGLSNWDVDVQQLSNLAVKRIFELGYDLEKHGRFDRDTNGRYNFSRSARKPERIGKKYQWIVFYELLARVADNFVMYDNAYLKDKQESKYQGPWEPYVRDIDPSILIRNTRRDSTQKMDRWWLQGEYDQWAPRYEDWVKTTSDLPEPSQIIHVNDLCDRNWLVLEAYPDWEEPVGIGIDKYEHPHKYLWYHIRSYIVKEEDFDAIVGWCGEKHFMGRWMPESRDMYQIFSREYYWSPAYKSFQDPYWYGETWREISARTGNGGVGKAIVTAETYLWEEEYDCSKDEVISFLKPAPELFEGLAMRFGVAEGELVNEEGECICFDPSVNNASPRSLLVRKDLLISFLQDSGLRMFWTVLGEKHIHGVGFGGEYPSDRLEFSGVYILDEGNVTGELKCFSEGKPESQSETR